MVSGLGQSLSSLTLSSGKRGASAFSPLDISPSLWLDPADLSNMFQDSAGTTPVTATGQPVGLIRDKSGNNRNASQSTAGFRPILQNDGSRNYLSFDGTDDYLDLSSTAAAIFQNVAASYIAARSQTAITLATVIMNVNVNGSAQLARHALQMNPNAGATQGNRVRRLDADAGVSSVLAAATSANVTLISVVDFVAGTSQLYSDGTLADSDALASSGGNSQNLVSGSVTVGGAINIATPQQFWNGRIYEIVAGLALSAGNRALLNTYLSR